MNAPVRNLLYPNILLSYFGLDIESTATEYEVSHLDEHLDHALLVKFVLLFLQILLQSWHVISLQGLLIGDASTNYSQILTVRFD